MLKPMIEGKDRISVCICTYKRPKLLEHLLSKLENQKTGDLFTYSIVVVDNDSAKSAQTIVEAFTKRTKVGVRYDMEPEPGFALVRNRAVANAEGNLVAFIDDDEFPEDDWLYQLYKAIKAYKADGILGPVLPHYEAEPPEWVVKGRLCERKSFQTGTTIGNASDTRTGNVLLDKALFNNSERPFDPRYGKMGGEDVVFFKRMMDKGKVFVWCNEAPVWEAVPRERMEKGYFLRRALLRGFLESKDMHLFHSSVLKSIVAVVLYTLTLPFFLLMGQHVFMKYLIKDCDHLGKLLGACGITLFKERAF